MSGNVVLGVTSPYLTYKQANGIFLSKSSLSNYTGNVVFNNITNATFAFQLQSNGARYFLGNASTGSIQTSYNTLDDGQGNALFNSRNGSTTSFRLQNNASTFFTANASTSAITTKNNTIDDGNGNAIFNSVNSSSTALVIKNNGTPIFTANASTNAITSKNNTLDDGSTGNMVCAGYLSESLKPMFQATSISWTSGVTSAFQPVTFTASIHRGGTVDVSIPNSGWSVPISGMYRVYGSMSGTNVSGASGTYQLAVSTGANQVYTPNIVRMKTTAYIPSTLEFNMSVSGEIYASAGAYLYLVFAMSDTGGSQVVGDYGYFQVVFAGYTNDP